MCIRDSLYIVTPSTPYDAKGLLKAAIRQDNPVVYIECAMLYHTLRGPVPEEEYTIPLGKADVKREGEDVTVVAISRTVHEALKAAEELEKRGISVEVVDPRTLKPLDKETILNSVKKTGRLVIISDECKTGSVAGEIAAMVAEEAIGYLDAPIVRVCTPDTPVPSLPPLLTEYMPNKDKIVRVIEKIVS